MFNLSHGFTAGFCWYVTDHKGAYSDTIRYSYEIEYMDATSVIGGSVIFYDKDAAETWWLSEVDAAKKAIEHCLTLKDSYEKLERLGLITAKETA